MPCDISGKKLALCTFVLSSYIIAICSASQEGFYAIAHMTNSKTALKHAIDAGANAVELDMKFNYTTGKPTEFYHGAPCDCTCYKYIPFSSSGGNLCSLSRNPCSTRTNYREMFRYLLTFPSVALIYLDSKIGDFPVKKQNLAALNIIKVIDKYLFEKGYKGKVLIGGGRDKPYLKAVAKYANPSKYSSRIFVTLDWNDKGSFDSLRFLSSLSTPNVVYSDGVTACHFRTYHQSIRTASINKANGVVSNVFIWTLDLQKSFDIYYKIGARGILTNKIGSLMSWVRANKIKLAAPEDDSLKPATAKQMINPKCDCDYHNGGCIVSKLPPTNSACRCKKTPILHKCSGIVVLCKNPGSKHCKRPGYTVHDCIQGSGNCDGYKNQKCDCTYRFNWGSGGCKISKPAPIHTACRCDYKVLACHGHVVACKDPNSSYCSAPDKSESSCLQGGGDCDAY